MTNIPSSLPEAFWPNKKEVGTVKNVLQNGPPPIPPRQHQPNSRLNCFNYGSGLSPYSRFPSSAYPTTYNRYRTPFNHYYSPYEENSFRQIADESIRPAFQSVETIVEVFSSISMMLESTYHAVYSSYSAILGVVDNVSRLKDHLAQIVSLLAFFRGLQWLCLKILYLLGLRREDSVEKVWEVAKKAFESSSQSGLENEKKSAWPIFWFIALAFGAPWIMFKLFSKGIHKQISDPTTWANENGALVAFARYDFVAENSQELSFNAGQKLILAPKSLQTRSKGWLLASNGKKIGLIPNNYVQIFKISKLVRAAKPPNSSSPLEIDSTSNTSQLDSAFIEASSSSSVQVENKNCDLKEN